MDLGLFCSHITHAGKYSTAAAAAPLMRSGRLTRAMYDAMGMLETGCCVAGSPEEYVIFAIELAKPGRWRDETRQMLGERGRRLFGEDTQRRVVAEWERFIRRATLSAVVRTTVGVSTA